MESFIEGLLTVIVDVINAGVGWFAARGLVAGFDGDSDGITLRFNEGIDLGVSDRHF